MAHHAELLSAEFWRVRQQRVRAGLLDDVFPYPESLRFARRLESSITLKEPST
jgi:isocitrate dehydrogenase kinase/phosphatase